MSASRLNILLVDDNRGSLLAYRTILEDLHQHLVCVDSGEEALRHLLETEFDLVLLDVRMPGMDGFEVAEMMRARKKSENTPILFLTAQDSSPEDIKRAFSLGAIDYLAKPISSEELRAKVAQILGLE